MTESYNKIIELAKTYNPRKIGIDAGSGSMGTSVCDFLLKVPGVNNKIVEMSNRKRAIDAEGKKSKKLLKEDMYYNLLAMMEHGEILLLRDYEVILSLKSVQYDTNAALPSLPRARYSPNGALATGFLIPKMRPKI